MKRVFCVGLAALAVALVVGPLAEAQMRGSSSSQYESGATACNGHGGAAGAVHLGAQADEGATGSEDCFCDPGWTGAQCESPVAPPDCGVHGKAVNMRCVCEAGWAGKSCDVACAHGKLGHGRCVCAAGWSGAACDVGAPTP
jgi:hypothetical protein